MGRVKERLQYLSYLKALEMTYRGVYVDYSEYEWMIYEETYNRSINQMLVDQDYEDFIEENFLDADGNYHLKVEEAKTGRELEQEQQIGNSSTCFNNNQHNMNIYVPEFVPEKYIVKEPNDNIELDKNITEMNELFVDRLTSNEITVDDITGNILDVLLSGMTLITGIQKGLNGEEDQNKKVNNDNFEHENRKIHNKTPENELKMENSSSSGKFVTNSPPISISSIDSGIGPYNELDKCCSEDGKISPKFEDFDEEGFIEPKLDIPSLSDKENNNMNDDEIPVWMKDPDLKENEFCEVDITTPQHSMASVIASQLKAAGNRKNNKKKGKNYHKHKKGGSSSPVYSYNSIMVSSS